MSEERENNEPAASAQASPETVEQRRKLLLGVGATGAIAVWHKPVVNAIMLPAHAQTSPILSFTVEKQQTGGPNPAVADGDVIEYTITVVNTGTGPITGVVATDTLPDGTVVILDSQSESLNSDDILEVGETWSYATTYTVTTEDLVNGNDLVNSVSVVTDEVPEQQTDDVATPVIVPAAEDLCPMIVIDNILTGPVSGNNVPPVCSVTFDVLSGTTGIPLNITEITTDTLPADTTFTIDGVGTATDLIGPRIVWRGPAVGAPFCMPFSLVTDLEFTVTATCDAAAGDTFSQTFNVSDLV